MSDKKSDTLEASGDENDANIETLLTGFGNNSRTLQRQMPLPPCQQGWWLKCVHFFLFVFIVIATPIDTIMAEPFYTQDYTSGDSLGQCKHH
jgi:hypothetical protein